MADYIGLRVARWRDIAGITQQQLADAVGVSRSYISLIEAGDRPVTKRTLMINLATALGVSVPQLLDQPARPRNRDDLVMSRAAAAVRIALDAGGPVDRPAAATLAERAGTVISLRAACDYAGLADQLPPLIADARAVGYDDARTEDERRVGLDAFVRACTFGTLALKTSGYVDLAVRVAEHAQAAADQLGPVHIAAAQFATCQALMAEGVRERARALSTTGADALAPMLDDEEARGWYVQLRLQAAICTASMGDHAGATAHLDDAAAVAARGTSGSTWHRDDMATNVDVWRVTCSLENGGDGEAAPDLARRVDRAALRTPQRLARLYMDTGRGMWARGDREATVDAFLAAYETAPGEVRNRGTVREIVGQMVRDTPQASGSERLQVLASRVGIDPLAEM